MYTFVVDKQKMVKRHASLNSCFRATCSNSFIFPANWHPRVTASSLDMKGIHSLAAHKRFHVCLEMVSVIGYFNALPKGNCNCIQRVAFGATNAFIYHRDCIGVISPDGLLGVISNDWMYCLPSVPYSNAKNISSQVGSRKPR